MHPWLGRRFLLAAIAILALASAPASQSTRLSVEDAVALYAHGEFERAVRELDTNQLMVGPFTRALDVWIAAGEPASAPRRRTIAVAFALEAVWVATRTVWTEHQLNSDPWKKITPDDPERTAITSYDAQGRIASWAVQYLPKTGAAESLERTLWLTAVAIAEDGHAWYRIQHDIVPTARNRLSDEPRLRLADVLARTNRDLGPLRRGTFAFRRHDVLRVEPLSSSGVPDAIRTFEPLLADAALAGEVELRIGYLELRRKRWPAALTRFDAAQAKSTEPVLRAAADYFAGWVYEQLEQTDDAIAAYRRAIALTPTMRNLATRLSALLYLRNERAEAYAILDPALNARPTSMDPLVMLERADARFMPDWLASIRKELR